MAMTRAGVVMMVVVVAVTVVSSRCHGRSRALPPDRCRAGRRLSIGQVSDDKMNGLLVGVPKLQ
jgi:hypothetical protein